MCAAQICIYLLFVLENGITDNNCYLCVCLWLKRPSWDQLSFPHCAHRKITLWFRRECTICKVNDCLLLNLDSQLWGVFPPEQVLWCLLFPSPFLNIEPSVALPPGVHLIQWYSVTVVLLQSWSWVWAVTWAIHWPLYLCSWLWVS